RQPRDELNVGIVFSQDDGQTHACACFRQLPSRSPSTSAAASAELDGRGMASVASCAAKMVASAMQVESADRPACISAESTPTGPEGPHIGTASEAGVESLAAVCRGEASRNAVEVMLLLSRGTLPMRRRS